MSKNYITFIWLLLWACSAAPGIVAEAQTVYITRTGAKYHRETCQYLRQSKIEINLKEARDRGYQACSVCSPPTSPDQGNTTVTTPANLEKPQQAKPTEQKKVTSQRCTATTKAGTRCKRTATNGSIRCWQHQ